MEPNEPNDPTEQSLELTSVRKPRTIADDPAAAQRKRDRESGRQQAQQDAPEMLAMAVQIARDMGNDTKDRMRAIEYVCNRAWGTPKAEQSEDPALTNKTILDILEQVSIQNASIEHDARMKAIEAQRVHPATVLPSATYELIEGTPVDDSTDRV